MNRACLLKKANLHKNIDMRAPFDLLKSNYLRMKRIILFLLINVLLSDLIYSQAIQNFNKPERIKWFEDLGFGMFIHWNVDVSLGVVISHSLAGASDEYVQKYISELPGFFNPKKFNPDEWAKLAKLAGMKYVVFTAKHHSGFCMFKTQTN